HSWSSGSRPSRLISFDWFPAVPGLRPGTELGAESNDDDSVVDELTKQGHIRQAQMFRAWEGPEQVQTRPGSPAQMEGGRCDGAPEAAASASSASASARIASAVGASVIRVVIRPVLAPARIEGTFLRPVARAMESGISRSRSRGGRTKRSEPG